MTVTFHRDLNLFEIRMKQSSYIMGINGKDALQHLYWGKRIEARECAFLLKLHHHSSFDAEVERERGEFGWWGGSFYGEPSLKVTFADEVRDLQLKYAGFAIRDQDGLPELVISLKDAHYNLEVRLHYKVIAEYDLIERYAELVNQDNREIVIEQVMSASWPIPLLDAYRLTHVAGRWSGEFQLRETMLSEGKKILESRSGFTGPHTNPWFAIDNGKADENAGEVWFGALGWSGNWKIVVEKTSFNHVNVVGGIHDFDCQITLGNGATFTTPVFTGGYTCQGFGDMSGKLHDYQRTYILPVKRPRRVLYNSWEATEFAVTAEGQKELARMAAKLGVELFVVDDGWFLNRNNDKAGLGDWYPDRRKFPGGLRELIDEVTGLGMDFGIWVEPESVNPQSELYRKHPDWVYQFPTRTGTLLRNQLTLNLGKPEVKRYILDFMTDLLSSYDITFIKWDMNRTITEPGSVFPSARFDKEIWVNHVQNLYDIWKELRRKFPHVEFETCAGGGSRIDFGILRYADQAWPSDNTDAFDRLKIQEGFSFVYCPNIMMCWVTDSPHRLNGRALPLSFRFHSAMMGGLGIGGNLKKWSQKELDEASAYIQLYKELRPLIQEGKLYRLLSLRNSAYASWQYVSKDQNEAVVFMFLHSGQFAAQTPLLKLRGLHPETIYQIEGLGKPFRFTGKNIMNVGLPVTLKGDFDSAIIRLKAVSS
jgi:alpha-galactosidase